MVRDLQVDIYHDAWSWYGSQRGREKGRGGTNDSGWLSYREANAFPDTIPRIQWCQTLAL